ncbi:IS481 family transposase [Roseibium album]|uniref:IS481 family transposase n=1 Tax=Roseibium album TaxID=311410 RepID=UPI0024937689|nr:IS481 family transposase [Roseibium album]
MNNPHQNARTCFYSREQIVRRYEAGEKACEIAAAFGISVRTVYKWLKRFREHGSSGLIARSSARRTCSNAYMAGWRNLTIELRHLRLTADEIADLLDFRRSTVAHALKAWGLNRLNRLTPPEPVRRYERDAPGDLLRLDMKKLGRFNKTGYHMTGHHRRKRSKCVGYDYEHVAIDDHSRVAYVEVLADERDFTCAMFLVRAARWFAAKGITIKQVMTDSGVGYRSNLFATTPQQIGARHIGTKPYTPQTNGKAERFINTLQEGWAYAAPYKTSEQRNVALPRWIEIYNCRRPHGFVLTGGEVPEYSAVPARLDMSIYKP